MCVSLTVQSFLLVVLLDNLNEMLKAFLSVMSTLSYKSCLNIAPRRHTKRHTTQSRETEKNIFMGPTGPGTNEDDPGEGQQQLTRLTAHEEVGCRGTRARPYNLKLGARWRSVVSFTLRILCPKGRRGGGSKTWRYWMWWSVKSRTPDPNLVASHFTDGSNSADPYFCTTICY
jgi:hypothetical protein